MVNNQETSINIIRGELGGPTICIFAGVHGNEKAGILVIDYLKNNLKITKGTVYLVIVNPPAVEKNIRQINKNLNRNIFFHDVISSYEDSIANELVEILNNSDALLDLHSFNESDNEPFAICGPMSNDVAIILGLKYVVNGINIISDSSTEGYMNKNNKIGVCVELGSSFSYEKYVDLGISVAFKFLNYFNMVEEVDYAFKNNVQNIEILQVLSFHKKKNEDFGFMQKLRTFDFLKKDTIFAKDGEELLKAEEDVCILFPRENDLVGIEAFILARKKVQ